MFNVYRMFSVYFMLNFYCFFYCLGRLFVFLCCNACSKEVSNALLLMEPLPSLSKSWKASLISVGGCVDGWVTMWMDGWMGGCVDVWMDG